MNLDIDKRENFNYNHRNTIAILFWMEGREMKCYLYTRVSTELQVDGYSLEAQKERLKKEAKHRGMKVVGEYSDEGKSGKNIKGRPEFQRMLMDIRTKKDDVDYVLVFKLSRFGRNAADTLSSLQLMEDYGVHLLCVEDGIDSAGAASKLMISVLAAVSEIERENIKEQTMAGRQQKARDGRWNGGFAPYGYKLVLKDGERSKVLEIEESEAELVRLIYDKFANTQMGANAVAKWLNEHAYTKTVRQNGTTPHISAHFVKLILDNPVYMGKIAYGRRRTEKIEGTRNEVHVVKQAEDTYELYKGIHEAIIPEDLWYRAHAKRLVTGVKHEKTHSLEHCHILSGLLRCPVCGAPMYGVVNRKKKKDGSGEFYTDMWYYKCKNRIKIDGQPCTFKKHIRQDQLNAEMIALIKWVIDDEEFKKSIAQTAGDSEGCSMDDLIQESERLQNIRDKAEKRKKTILEKIKNIDLDNDLSDQIMDDYMGLVRELTEKIAQVDADIMKNELAIENMKQEVFTVEQYYRMMDAMIKNLEYETDEHLRLLMHGFIEKIEIYPEKTNGRWVKSVQFKIGLNVDGNICFTFGVDEENSLTYETHDECVVLMSKVKE